MAKSGLAVLLLLGLVAPVVFSDEQAGPNPSNLTPAGSQGVSLFTGAFTYAYPIIAPPGRRGIQPDLNLLYNSQAQNGWLGVGWDLGLGSIQRSTKNGIPTYNDSLDSFVIQFQGETDTLVTVGSGSDANGSYREYRAQIEVSFRRVRFYSNPPSPSFWVVTSKDGTQYRFEGLAQNLLTTSSSNFFYWGLTKVFDPLGNFMAISYPSLSSATTSGAPGPGGTPTAFKNASALIGFMPASISYTGKCTGVACQTVMLSTSNQITFSYEIRPDSITRASVGCGEVIVTRLKSIRTSSNGNAVRTYAISYSTNLVVGSLLTGISLVGSDGVSVLSTTTFSYAGSANYSVTLSTGYDLPVDFNNAELVDVNGDNLPDLIESYTSIGSGTWLNTGNGWSASSAWISPVAFVTPTQYSASAGDQGVRFADINGDGLVDIVQNRAQSPNLNVAASSAVWLNTGGGWNVSASTSLIPPVNFTDSINASNTGALLMDVNGDGLPDIVQSYVTNLYNCFSGVWTNNLYSQSAWVNSGNGWVSSATWLSPASIIESWQNSPFVGTCPTAYQIDLGVRFADLNSDGLIDVLVGKGTSTSIGINVGIGWAFLPQFYAPTAFVSNTGVDTGLRVVDINGDGFPDLVQYSSSPVVSHIWLNTGNGWIQADSFASAISSISAHSLEFVDLSGDNVPDIIALSTDPASDRIYIGHTTPSNVMARVNNGIGGLTQITYAFSPPPLQPIHLPPLTVVQSLTTSDGISGHTIMTSSYVFSGGLFDNSRPNREFLGFQQVINSDAEGNSTVTQFFQTQNAVNGVNVFKGKISAQNKYDALGSLLAMSTYSVSYSTPFVGIYFPFTAEEDSYVGNKESAKGYVYDSSGNVTREIDYGDVAATGDERTIVTTYSSSTGPYLVGYPLMNQIFAGAGTIGSLLSQTSFYYDASFSTSPALGLLTKTDKFLFGGTDPVTISSFDSFGNITDTYDALYNATGGAQGNHVQLTYDTTSHQFPRSIQQGVGSSLTLPPEIYAYDPATGQILSHVDVNGSTSTYIYDTFGRLSIAVGPADQVTASSPTLTYGYNFSTSPPHSIVANARVVHGSTLSLATYTFFDGMSRKIEAKTAAAAGKQIVDGMVSFNELGLASTAYVPVRLAASGSYVTPVSTQPFAATFYDGLRRIIKVVSPDGTISTKAYQDWTETDTDANGHIKTYVKNAYGQIVEVDERGVGTTAYQYDLLGNLTGIVNAQGQATALTYDTLGRKTEMSDPQMGIWHYEYDPNWNLIQQTDGKNHAVTMTYDPLNRQTFKVYPDSTTLSYFYDSGSFGKGRLSQVVDLSGSQQFAYDSDGNVLSNIRTIGGRSYVSTMTYDALDRGTSFAYPDTMVVRDIYDAFDLSAVQAASGALAYATLTYSTAAPSKLGSVTYGNGMTAQYSYDQKMLRLANLKALTSGTTIQNFAYQYDHVGNISQIVDGVRATTQSFSYDSVNRLTQASGAYGANNYQYDAIGNLTLNSDTASGSWGFGDTSDVASVQGLVVSTNGRIGNGLNFDGASEATINASSGISPPATITIALWVRPKALGSGYVVSKGGSFFFPQVESDGSIDAKLELSSGEQLVHISSGSLFNLWSYYVLTYDGTNINVYVNGQLWISQSASGTIQTSTQTILLGSSFRGGIDELSIYPYALSAGEIIQRYQLYPNLVLSQPFTPDSVPAGMTAAVVDSTYTFTFTGWDLNGNGLKYRIDWGTGTYEDGAYVPSGTAVQATHTWTSTGTYGIRLESVGQFSGSTSAWSPSCNVLIVSTAIHAGLNPNFLIGASANAGATSLRAISNTAGEVVTGEMNSSQTIGYLGYRGTSTYSGPWGPIFLGQQAPGGVDAPPTQELVASDLVNLQYSTASADVSAIALNLLEHGTTSFTDANGNLQVENGRWIAYDFENRPVRIVTQDATLLQFVYDFEGNRTQQSITAVGQSSQTTTYAGSLFETTGTNTIKYVNAGQLHVAMLSSNGATAYFLPDHLGSTNLLVDSSLSAVRNTQYMPFGSTFETSGTADNDHKFIWKRADVTRLYYYGARYYDPFSGRFISPDTIIQDPYNPQALNRYAYSLNNPVTLLDTDGHLVVEAPVLVPVFAFVGAAAGAASAYGLGLNAMETAASHGAIEGAIFGFGVSLGVPTLGASLALSQAAAFSGASPAQVGMIAVSGGFAAGIPAASMGMGGAAIGTTFSQTIAVGAAAIPAVGAVLNVEISQEGLNLVESHLAEFEEFGPNMQMLQNLKDAFSAGQTVTGANANFYLHEMTEATLMQSGSGYDAAHAAALQQFGVSEFNLYTPEIIQSNPSLFNTTWQNTVPMAPNP